MKNTFFFIAFLLCSITNLSAQSDRWQQAITYDMDIKMDVTTHQFEGKQKIVYTNNSPDTLTKVFYHLYLNAFQPGSMMDTRSISISDPDRRVRDRISKLTPEEYGFTKVNSLKQNGKNTKFEIAETILEVELAEPILPGSKTTLEMEFLSQTPKQIRRNGRDSHEGVDYSMAQWYPKLCEYDYQGWHPNPYVGREFYGVWGDFDVKIEMPASYTVAATGVLQNAKTIGHGYEGITKKHRKKKRLTWHFRGENIHDFVWAADEDYKHTIKKAACGVDMHFFYIPGEKTNENWENLPDVMDKVFDYINENHGEYPYPIYSFIQGGDGGMEYPMATLITGERTFSSLVGVSIHELYHSWYQMILGSNEALYAWMDEGFTSHGSARCNNYLKEKGFMKGKPTANPAANSYKGYKNLVTSQLEEPLSTHADHFNTNFAYGMAAYSKGAVFLGAIEHIIGKTAFEKGMKRYYNEWKFKHPNVNDFIRVMEKESDLELDWFKEYFVYTTKTIDYAVKEVVAKNNKTSITLSNESNFPMPIDLVIELNDGSTKTFNIPLQIMRGNKKAMNQKVLTDWQWTDKEYNTVIDINFENIKSVHINKSELLPDLNPDNNSFVK